MLYKKFVTYITYPPKNFYLKHSFASLVYKDPNIHFPHPVAIHVHRYKRYP